MNQTILLVEDDPDVLDIVSLLVAEFGYEVFSALNRDEALRVIRKHEPDLILMDYHMPGMTFANFILTMMNEFPTVRIVLYSADDVKQIAPLYGIKYWIQKPFISVQLKSLLTDCLNNDPGTLMLPMHDTRP